MKSIITLVLAMLWAPTTYSYLWTLLGCCTPYTYTPPVYPVAYPAVYPATYTSYAAAPQATFTYAASPKYIVQQKPAPTYSLKQPYASTYDAEVSTHFPQYKMMSTMLTGPPAAQPSPYQQQLFWSQEPNRTELIQNDQNARRLISDPTVQPPHPVTKLEEDENMKKLMQELSRYSPETINYFKEKTPVAPKIKTFTFKKVNKNKNKKPEQEKRKQWETEKEEVVKDRNKVCDDDVCDEGFIPIGVGPKPPQASDEPAQLPPNIRNKCLTLIVSTTSESRGMRSTMILMVVMVVGVGAADISAMLNLTDVFDTMPKECTKNGKKFKEGEDFEFGNLRYKCQKYGVYSIEGCQTDDKKHLKLGESVTIENIRHQCLSHDSTVYYRQTTCGIMGQPSCDEVPPPERFLEATKKSASSQKSVKHLGEVGNLPPGWRVVDGGTKRVEGSNATIITKIIEFSPISSQDKLRARRESGEGVGGVVGVETFMDPQRPQMPTSMLPTKTTQTVGANLRLIKSGGKGEAGLEDLNARSPTVTDNRFKAGTMSGSRSFLDFKNKKIIVNGKTVGTGEGTFTFGNKPTQS
ncbi:unnamed protein product [Caenorhabditis auriculariae]|uniref:Abnormal cell migration protein 18-like fibronectin type I domain-containing protein n=1 Tax=Caenorhabditis auriculariae TaxID=2777116 RepID=A0A8S1HR40_9PELO|nr:unnamed protein product [Caenorhabditis auriculariae]